MDITFKYKGKLITTPNLEKKLKRMKLTINDIEIVDSLILKEEKINIDDFYKTHTPYLEPINTGYAVHFLKNELDFPSHWIPAKIEGNKIVKNERINL